MYSGPTQTESYTALPLHQRGINPRSNDQSAPPYEYPPRSVIGLPPPIEPRTSHPLQSAFSDPPPPQPRRDTYAGPSAPHLSERRPHGQSLPRLQDILTSAASPPPVTPAHAPYSSPWAAPAPPSVNSHRTDGYYRHGELHPPLVYPAPPHLSAATPSYGPRRMDLPTLETTMPPGQRSPRSTSDAGIDHGDVRHPGLRQPSTNSYMTHGVPSPYTPGGAEDAAYRNPMASFDRYPHGPYGPEGPEYQRKYLGIRDVPGEGSYHLYEGGHRIPTHVDGEQVNPAWGLTKANKPRKRLAMACLDCREKKIKCEPGVNSCLQCEKAKRPCRKAPAQQTQSETTSTTVWQSGGTPPARRDSSDPTHSSARGMDVDPAQKRRTRDEHSPSRLPAKKHRSTSPRIAPRDVSNMPRSSVEYVYSVPTTATPHSPDSRPWHEEDPFAADPDTVVHLMQSYFANVNSMIYNLFPRVRFMQWVKSGSPKWQDERIVLYALIAVGSIFADGNFSNYGHHCASIASEAINSTIGYPNILILQARLILSIWYSSRGEQAMVSDYLKLAASAANLLRFDTEQGCRPDNKTEPARNEYDFSNEQVTESRRRTMWAMVLMDRYSASPTCEIDANNIFVRLPCPDALYESGIPSDAPLLSDALIGRPDSPLSANSPISTNGWLLLMAAVCGDVVNFIHRAPHRPARTYREEYERFYDETYACLQNWSSRLPEYLRFNMANIERSVEGGYAGPLAAMHILYHYSAMKLNRFFRHALLPERVSRNIRLAHKHAQALLNIAIDLQSTKWVMAPDGRQPIPFSFTLPFVGQATLSAIDIVGAGGIDTNMGTTLSLIESALGCLRSLTTHWALAQNQSKKCNMRYYQIQNIIRNPHTARSGCWLGREWGICDPFEGELGPENDCIFGVSGPAYYAAMKKDECSTASVSPMLRNLTNGDSRT